MQIVQSKFPVSEKLNELTACKFPDVITTSDWHITFHDSHFPAADFSLEALAFIALIQVVNCFPNYHFPRGHFLSLSLSLY